MFPLSTVLFPGASLPLHVFEPRYRALLADSLVGNGGFGVVLIDRGSEVGGGDHRVDVGTMADIVQVFGVEGGRSMVMTRGTRRIRVARWLSDDPYPRAMVEDHPSPTGPDGARGVEEARRALARLCSLLSELGEDVALPPGPDPSGSDEALAWALCRRAPLGPLDQQSLLASPDTSSRMTRLAELCRAAADDVVHLLSDGGR